MTARAAATPNHAPRGPRVPFAVLVVSLIIGGLALLLALNTASAANEIRRRDLVAQDATVAAQLQGLRNQVAASAADSNLGREARAQGMVLATRPAFLVIGADGKIRMLGKPGAVSGVPVAASATSTSHPAPTKTAKPGATPSTSKSASKSASRSTSPSASRSGRATSSKATPKPTPTPTPTVTLPGGDR